MKPCLHHDGYSWRCGPQRLDEASALRYLETKGITFPVRKRHGTKRAWYYRLSQAKSPLPSLVVKDAGLRSYEIGLVTNEMIVPEDTIVVDTSSSLIAPKALSTESKKKGLKRLKSKDSPTKKPDRRSLASVANISSTIEVTQFELRRSMRLFLRNT